MENKRMNKKRVIFYKTHQVVFQQLMGLIVHDDCSMSAIKLSATALINDVVMESWTLNSVGVFAFFSNFGKMSDNAGSGQSRYLLFPDDVIR